MVRREEKGPPLQQQVAVFSPLQPPLFLLSFLASQFSLLRHALQTLHPASKQFPLLKTDSNRAPVANVTGRTRSQPVLTQAASTWAYVPRGELCSGQGKAAVAGPRATCMFPPFQFTVLNCCSSFSGRQRFSRNLDYVQRASVCSLRAFTLTENPASHAERF